ncbi:hypothetical protein TWF718_000528 [Orbilia javanica]|uniref:Uncharacterized protein n=1 Tax=Orbilia javanica TaxID=47235 RepID=A0AAN8N4F8_9PEZI
MSKKEVMEISETKRAKLLEMETFRTADDIIRELDCLLYLQEEAGRYLNELFSGDRIPTPAGYNFSMMSAVCDRIEEVLKKVRRESWKVLRRLLLKGDKATAYILGALSCGTISYCPNIIRREYTDNQYLGHGEGPQGPSQALLDESVGLHFRRLKGLEILSKPNSSSNGPNERTSFAAADISHLYKTLAVVVGMCNEGFEYDPSFGMDKAVYERIYGNGYAFQTLSPLFLMAFALNNEYAPGTHNCITEWPQVIGLVVPKDLDEYSNGAKVHVVAANYFWEKSCFFPVMNAISSRQYLNSYQSHSGYQYYNSPTEWPALQKPMLGRGNDAAIRLSIVLGMFDAFEHLIDVYETFQSFFPDAPAFADYPLTLPGFQAVQVPRKLPLTAFMLAIMASRPGDATSMRFVDRFLDSQVLHSWTEEISTPLFSVLDMEFARDDSMRVINLRPIHLAGLLGRTDLFKKLLKFEFDKPPHFAFSAVALAALHNDDAAFFPLLSHFFESTNSIPYSAAPIHWIIRIIKQYGSKRLAESIDEFISQQNWLPTLDWSMELLDSNTMYAGHDKSYSEGQNKLDLELPKQSRVHDASTEDPDIELSDCLDDGTEEFKRYSDLDSKLDIMLPPLWSPRALGLESYETDFFTTMISMDSKKGTKTRITTITVTSRSTSETNSSSKNILSLGGMPFLVPSSRKRISDTCAQDMQKEKQMGDDVIIIGN